MGLNEEVECEYLVKTGSIYLESWKGNETVDVYDR
jgi:hypothetical protein